MFFKNHLYAFGVEPCFTTFSDVFLSFILDIYKDYSIRWL